MNCKSNLRLLRNSKYVCWNLFRKFLTFNYLKYCVKTVSPKTWHHTRAGRDQELLWAALSNLNKPSALAQVSCCGQKAPNRACCRPRLQPSWFPLHWAALGSTTVAIQGHLTIYRAHCAGPHSSEEQLSLWNSLWNTGIIKILPLISYIKVQWGIQVPLMILIVILISITFLPSRLFPVISTAKVLALAISTEHTDFI